MGETQGKKKRICRCIKTRRRTTTVEVLLKSSWGETQERRKIICRCIKTRRGTTTVEVLLKAHGEKFKKEGKESADALQRVGEQQQ